MNRSGDRYNMSTDYAWDLFNCFSDVSSDGRGAIQQRDGIVSIISGSALAGKIRYVIEQAWASGITEIICRAYDGWYRVSAGAFTSLDVSRTVDARGQSTVYDNYFIMTDGGVPRKSDTAHTITDMCTDVNMPQTASACHTHDNRVWLNETGTMEIRGSKVGNPYAADSYTASGHIRINLQKVLPEWDEPIGFETVGDGLLAIYGSKYVTYYYAPEVTASLNLITFKRIDTMSAQAFTSFANDFAIGTKTGLNSLKSTNTFEKLKIDDLTSLNEPLWLDLVNDEVDVKDICMVLNTSKNQIYVTFHSLTDSTTLVYGVRDKNIIGRYQFNKIPYSWFEKANGDLIFGASDGKIYKHSTLETNDDGETIDFQWILPHFGGKNPISFKAPREMQLLVHSNITANISVDYWSGLSSDVPQTKLFNIDITFSPWRSGLWRSGLWRSLGTQLKENPHFNGRGRFIGFTVRHDTLGARVRIPYLIVKYKLEGAK
jgi:hypothetical protein